MITLFGIIAAFVLYIYVLHPNSELISPTVTEMPSGSPASSPSVSAPVPPQPSAVKQNHMHQITLQTNLGDITFDTYDAYAPKAVDNFITLAKKGFYKNLIFHRVIKGFMIQGGDPNGNGTGGPGYSFEDELNPGTESYKLGYIKGVVAMANAGPNTNGSQFFIMLQDNPLPHNYTIFGKVIAGQNIVDAIGEVKTNGSDKPLEDVIMKAVIVNTK